MWCEQCGVSIVGCTMCVQCGVSNVGCVMWGARCVILCSLNQDK